VSTPRAIFSLTEPPGNPRHSNILIKTFGHLNKPTFVTVCYALLHFLNSRPAINGSFPMLHFSHFHHFSHFGHFAKRKNPNKSANPSLQSLFFATRFSAAQRGRGNLMRRAEFKGHSRHHRRHLSKQHLRIVWR
jgi:hypothetical protein